MMYASKIIIVKNKLTIKFIETIIIDHILTINKLLKLNINNDDIFTINYIDFVTTIDIQRSRLETDQEFKTRIEKETAYNKRYDEFHKNK